MWSRFMQAPTNKPWWDKVPDQEDMIKLSTDNMNATQRMVLNVQGQHMILVILLRKFFQYSVMSSSIFLNSHNKETLRIYFLRLSFNNGIVQIII